MKRLRDLTPRIISPLIFLLLCAARVGAAEGEPRDLPGALDPPALLEVVPLEVDAVEATQAGEATGEGEAAAPFALEGEEPAAREPVSADERRVEALEQKGGWLGFSAVARDGYGGRAMEYGLLRSSRSGGLFYRNMKLDSNLELEAEFLNQDDYHGDLLLDFGGDYRLHLRTESLYHNLDRELLFTDPFRFTRSDDIFQQAEYLPSQQDASRNYGVSVDQDLAHFRYRLHNYPLHVNLAYWRLVKKGTIQQRFSDHSFEGGPNTIYAVSRPIERQIHEGRLGFDVHLGPVDVVFDFRGRIFDDRRAIPVATFVSRPDLTGNLERVGGARQHNDEPEGRFVSHTVKLHSSLTGGIVGSGSYSFEQRENRSRLTDTTGLRGAKARVHNAAADLVYTPGKEYSLAFKYRRQEVDHGVHGLISSNNFVEPVQPARPSVDSVKDIIITTLSYRPRNDLSLTGEYRGQFLSRDNTTDSPTGTTWVLPEHSATHTGSLALLYRPVKGLRTSANYSYSTTDNPSYGASYEQRHEGKLMATYARNNVWGATANAVVRREWNDEVEHFLVDMLFDQQTGRLNFTGYTPYPLTSRDRSTENASVGVWVSPVERVTLGANYYHLQNRVHQPVLFTAVGAGSEADARFTSRSHVYSVNASYAASQALDLSLMLQQLRSRSAFTPEDTTFTATSDTSGIREISRQQTVISSLSARAEYRFTESVSTALDYSVRDYDEENPSYSWGNGTVHVIVAGVTGKWD